MLAAHQPLGLQPVDQPSQAGPGEQDAVGKLGHPQPPARRLGQLQKHVVPGEGQTRLSDQFALQIAHHAGMRAKEGSPHTDPPIGGAEPLAVPSLIGEQVARNSRRT